MKEKLAYVRSLAIRTLCAPPLCSASVLRLCALCVKSLRFPSFSVLPRATVYAEKIERPGNLAAAPNSSSIRKSWLYFAIRSVRDAEPVLI